MSKEVLKHAKHVEFAALMTSRARTGSSPAVSLAVQDGPTPRGQHASGRLLGRKPLTIRL